METYHVLHRQNSADAGNLNKKQNSWKCLAGWVASMVINQSLVEINDLP